MISTSLTSAGAVATTDEADAIGAAGRRVREGVRPPAYLVRKRMAIRVLGTLMAVVLAPVILALIVLVRLTSPGPGLYRQRRLGLNGAVFTIYKLRSMRTDAEATTGPVWSGKGDARVTLVGRMLRYLHLDELPQIINVVRGEMDFVGPRPERPEIAARLARIIPQYDQRLLALPGITGVAQVNLPPDETLDCVRRKLAADLYYIENASAWLDFRLVLATVLRMCCIRYHRGARLLGVAHVPPAVPLADATSTGGAGLPDDQDPPLESALDDTGEFVSIGETLADLNRHASNGGVAVATRPRKPR